MKLVTIFLACSMLCGIHKTDHEINLYNSSGSATAYIDDYLTDQVVYLWDGTPVAYLHKNFTSTDVYWFNGKHLGWFEDGLLRNNDGYIVLATRQAAGKLTYGETLKGLKNTPPEKKYRELEPVKPYFGTLWASASAAEYLQAGTGN